MKAAVVRTPKVRWFNTFLGATDQQMYGNAIASLVLIGVMSYLGAVALMRAGA